MELEKLCREVIEIAAKVGGFIQGEYHGFSKDKVQFKSHHAHDLVSYVDITAEAMLIESLGVILPEAGFIAEENHPSYKEGLNWIIDPLDGTTNFVQGIPHFCVSIALSNDQDLLLGVVYEVNQNECYYTWKGGLSYCNSQVISTSDIGSINDAFVATGFSVKNNDRLDANLRLLKLWISRTRGIRRLGSAALDLCYLAKGVYDLFYETDLSAWDVAAGALIVQNAGGAVSTFDGGNNFLNGGEILASNQALHQILLDELAGIV